MSFTVHNVITDESLVSHPFPDTEKPAAIAFAKALSKTIPYALFIRQDGTDVMVAMQGSVIPAGKNGYDTARTMRSHQSESAKSALKGGVGTATADNKRKFKNSKQKGDTAAPLPKNDAKPTANALQA